MNRSVKPDPDVSLVRLYLSYDPETGVFIRIRLHKDRGKKSCLNREAGTIDYHGYRVIRVGSKTIGAQRIAWAYMTGEWPKQLVDHKDRDKLNNRWANLRLATNTQNEANSTVRRSGHPKGVKLHKHGKWEARVTKNYRQHYFGIYDTMEEAVAAYHRGAIELFGSEWATVGE